MSAAQARAYLETMVLPTIEEFGTVPSDRRRAFIACLVTFHTVDYLTRPASPADLRARLRHASPDFALVDRVAHAFKHVASGHKNSAEMPLLHHDDISTRPPALAGVMMAGRSQAGDCWGAVEVDGENVLAAVGRAAEFLQEWASKEDAIS